MYNKFEQILYRHMLTIQQTETLLYYILYAGLFLQWPSEGQAKVRQFYIPVHVQLWAVNNCLWVQMYEFISSADCNINLHVHVCYSSSCICSLFNHNYIYFILFFNFSETADWNLLTHIWAGWISTIFVDQMMLQSFSD